MPKVLKTAFYAKGYYRLAEAYQKAETEIIRAISYKNRNGYVDYAEHAALDRVQKTLAEMLGTTRKYAPDLIRKQYITGKKHIMGYINAYTMTATDTDIVQRLVSNLLADITEAAVTTNRLIKETWDKSVILGRQENDIFRTAALEGTIRGEATGLGRRQAQAIFIEEMKKEGVTAFVDKAGRHWSLRSYADMATRTTSRQSTNMGVLIADPEHDLYLMSKHGSTCPICAPLEGRVYSRSGNDPIYPPLTLAFGKIDPTGPDDLNNTYLNIHPNCLHVLTRYYEEGRSEREIEYMRKFSSPETNPINKDPRSKAQQTAYRQKEQARSKLLNDFKQFERYKLVLGDDVPKTFQTFLKHKTGDTEKYQTWQELYRKQNAALQSVK